MMTFPLWIGNELELGRVGDIYLIGLGRIVYNVLFCILCIFIL